MDDYILNQIENNKSYNLSDSSVNTLPDITPSTTRFLKSGTQKLSSFFFAIKNRDIFEAVKILCAPTNNTITSSDVNIHRGKYETKIDHDQAETMRRCWDSSSSNAEVIKEEESTDSLASLISQVDTFINSFEQKRSRGHTVSVGVTGLFQLATDFTKPLIFGKTKQELLLDKAKELKKDLVKYAEEASKEELNVPIKDLPRAPVFAPPPPPPPPPPRSFDSNTAVFSIPTTIAMPTALVLSNNRPYSSQSCYSTASTPQKQNSIKSQIEEKFHNGRPKLKKTENKRSPGGTPVRKKSVDQNSVEFALVDSLKKRFRSMRMHDHDDSDEETTSSSFNTFNSTTSVNKSTAEEKRPPIIPPKTNTVKNFAAKLRRKKLQQ